MLFPRNSLCHDADFFIHAERILTHNSAKMLSGNPSAVHKRRRRVYGPDRFRPSAVCVTGDVNRCCCSSGMWACMCVCVCVWATLDIFLDQEWKTGAPLKLYNTNNNNNNRFSARQKSQRWSLVATLQTVTGVSYSDVTARWTYRNSWCRYFQHPSLFRQSRNTPYTQHVQEPYLYFLSKLNYSTPSLFSVASKNL